MKKISTFITLAVLLTTVNVKANNIQVANVILNGQNTNNKFSIVNFDVSWENSWRLVTNQANYDGAWIFIKFRKVSGSVWQHATINTTGITAPAGSTIQVSSDGKGVWIYHAKSNTDFAGNVNYTGAKIRWNYGVDGVLNTDSVEIKVFALEMVYVPTGAYQLGSGGSETNHFSVANGNNPYNVTAENAQIAVSKTESAFNSPNALYYCNCDGNGGDQLGPIPAAFPKGYNAFWIMKYECSVQQYVDFLNNIDGSMAINRAAGGYDDFIGGIQPNLTSPIPFKALIDGTIGNYLAFADWAALRPFTELEFEKACRGTSVAVQNEYPWGNTTIAPTTTLLNVNLANEAATDGNANYETISDQGEPVYVTRTGIYATTTSARTSSGGTYYGAMDMAGNVTEICISVGSPGGRAFTAVNGDGSLDANGDANVSTWPSVATGFEERGGHFNVKSTIQLCTSNRSVFLSNGFEGIRLARTAE